MFVCNCVEYDIDTAVDLCLLYVYLPNLSNFTYKCKQLACTYTFANLVLTIILIKSL